MQRFPAGPRGRVRATSENPGGPGRQPAASDLGDKRAQHGVLIVRLGRAAGSVAATGHVPDVNKVRRLQIPRLLPSPSDICSVSVAFAPLTSSPLNVSPGKRVRLPEQRPEPTLPSLPRPPRAARRTASAAGSSEPRGTGLWGRSRRRSGPLAPPAGSARPSPRGRHPQGTLLPRGELDLLEFNTRPVLSLRLQTRSPGRPCPSFNRTEVENLHPQHDASADP